MPRTAPEMPQRLARCAFEVFAQRGLKDATVEEIAARAGVTKGSFYSHYKSKHAVILAACGHYYRTYQRRVHAEIAAMVDPLARLRRAVEFSVHTCVIDQQSRVFTTEVFAMALKDQPVRAGWAQFYDSVREMYVGLLSAACAAGQCSMPNPRGAVDLMLAAIEGVKLRATFEPQVSAPQEQESIVADLLGILGVAASQPCSTAAPSPQS